MRVSIQIALFNGWENNAPAFHTVENWQEAEDIAYALSHQFANSTVRICQLNINVPETLEYVTRLSGTYIQSKDNNTQETCDYVQKLLSK